MRRSSKKVTRRKPKAQKFIEVKEVPIADTRPQTITNILNAIDALYVRMSEYTKMVDLINHRVRVLEEKK